MVKDHYVQEEGRKWGVLTTHSAHFIYGKGPLSTRGRKEMGFFNDALSTFYLWAYGNGPLSTRERKEGRKWGFLTTHSAHFIYGHMVKDHSAQEKGRKEGIGVF